MTDYIPKKDAITLLLATSAATAVIGFGLSLAFVPVPETKQKCTLYKVERQPETSFVLKSPELVCPQTPKCDPVVNNPQPPTIDDQTSTKETVDEEPKHRHKKWRRHRIRRRWR